MRVKDAVGRFGEQVACEYLERQDLHIVERNWRCASGELDVIALDGDELVVVEVKTRSSERFGSPLDAIDRAKVGRIRRLAVQWMATVTDAPRPVWRTVRFDVVAVLRHRDGSGVEITHVRDAF